MENEGFNPQEEAFFKKGDKITADSEALAKGETTVGAKKAEEIKKDSDSWFEGKPKDQKF